MNLKNIYFFLILFCKTAVKSIIIYYILFGKLIFYPWGIFCVFYIAWACFNKLVSVAISIKEISENFELLIFLLYLVQRHFKAVGSLLSMLFHYLMDLLIIYFDLFHITEIKKAELKWFALFLAVMLL